MTFPFGSTSKAESRKPQPSRLSAPSVARGWCGGVNRWPSMGDRLLLHVRLRGACGAPNRSGIPQGGRCVYPRVIHPQSPMLTAVLPLALTPPAPAQVPVATAFTTTGAGRRVHAQQRWFTLGHGNVEFLPQGRRVVGQQYSLPSSARAA